LNGSKWKARRDTGDIQGALPPFPSPFAFYVTRKKLNFCRKKTKVKSQEKVRDYKLDKAKHNVVSCLLMSSYALKIGLVNIHPKKQFFSYYSPNTHLSTTKLLQKTQ
jgi:hypothetical protein